MNTMTVLIFIHAALGGFALLSGLIPMVAQKGGNLHIKAGKLFYYSMLLSTHISLIVSLSETHFNLFLFAIGVFTIYLLIGGKRSLYFRNKEIDLKFDQWLAWSMILCGLGMILIPFYFYGRILIVLFVFGFIGTLLGINDLRIFKNPHTLKACWLKLHITKMVGAYVATVSAFLVVNNFLPGLLNWFGAGIFGGVYIYYWLYKLKYQSKKIFLPS